MDFKELKTTKKGDVGEYIVKEFLLSKEYAIYKSEEEDSGHLIDFIAVKDSKAFAIDVKTKPKREKYEDTGFDLADFKKYQKLNESIQVILVFVDEKKKEVYGNSLDKLTVGIQVAGKVYPSIEDATKVSVIYFPLERMTVYKKLTDEECKNMSELSGRNEIYDKE